ncbi:MAG: ABC transporter ATP-binding protein [Armatimonadota bacterium]|nr:ABC transporter ATP-binding protein [Armatimonadota bacterium]MDR7452962.1 ABC transporter ATP-binding protein [Armatimonadota bacterium]MDR7456361.1 ABC transporter ATP-binding protein [Armatimonadota bacterium]MDR7496711.1 ABC transporter ATP-binding protein [Armatimonadota bacterium]MDR7511190.1 ABC transporter ATP-binding protein [Armatimonadota bacterium]
MEVVLAARGITKRFPGVLALDRVDLEVPGGEIHAVLGQNGAGKTTLMNVLFGLVQPDEGALFLHGRRVEFRSPHDALTHGIGMVHQTRRLVAAHTVLENIVLGHPRVRGVLSLRDARVEVAALCRRYGVGLDLGARVWQLSEGERQWVEILKALYRGARVLILDEPTSVLTPPEAAALLAGLQAMVRGEGVTALLVTHKLPTVMSACDRVTVLRAGRVVGRLRTAEATEDLLVRYMVGRDVAPGPAGPSGAPGRRVLEVEDLACLGDRGVAALRGVSFALREGEILGIAGVAGNGQEELAQVLAGLRPATAGRVRLDGRDITRLPPVARWALGVGYIPAERTEVASIGAFSLVDNTALTYHFDPAYVRRGLLDDAGLARLTRRIIDGFDVKVPHPYARARQLSGGNLQKMILGRVLSRAPRVLIAHLPTQGLDVEATAFVRAQLREAAAGGAAVVLISEDLDEIVALGDWVAPIYEGRFVAWLGREQADPETVGAMMAGRRREWAAAR